MENLNLFPQYLLIYQCFDFGTFQSKLFKKIVIGSILSNKRICLPGNSTLQQIFHFIVRALDFEDKIEYDQRLSNINVSVLR